MKKLLITEEDRRHILNLYGLINEQEVTIPPPMDVLINFQSGCHSNKGGNKCSANQVSNNIDPKIKEIEDFLRKAPKGKLIEVVLSSGESQVPNKDAEKTDLPRLKPGVLSQMRYTSLEQYLTTKFQTWISQGVISSMPRLTKIDPVIGPTAWDPKKGAQHPDYTKEQFMKVTLRVTNEPVTQTTTVKVTGETTIPNVDPGCAVGLKIRVYVPTHKCQNAEFFIFANNTLLYNVSGGMTANLNNADTSLGVPTSSAQKFSKKLLNPGYGLLPNGDETTGSYKYGNKNNNGDLNGYRSDTFIVTQEQSAKIVKEGNGFINIWMVATTKNAHRDIPVVTIRKIVDGKETVVLPPTEKKAVQSKLLTLDACGNKVVDTDNGATAPVITTYLNQLLAQKNNIKKGIKPGEEGEEKIDTKQLVLDRTSDLITKATSLMNFIIDTPSTKEELPKIQERITNDYNVFYTELNKEPKLTKTPSGKYENETWNGKMYGDVRMDLDLFYRIFDGVYKKDGKIDPTGIKAEGSSRLGLGTIRGNMRKIKNTLMLQA